MATFEELSVEERIALLSRRYSNEAGVYERRWAPGLREAGEELLDHLDLAGTEALLDVGAGVGALLASMRERATEAFIVGSDRAEGMLSLASRSFGLVVGDLTGLPFTDSAFDAVTMNFVLFHLQDPVDGLSEAHRVLRRGGRAGATTWGDEETWPVREVWGEELDRFGAAPVEGLFSLHELVDTPEKMSMHMRDAGLGEVEAWIGKLRQRWGVEEYIEFATGMAIPKLRFDSLDPESRPRLLEAVTGRLEELSGDDMLQTSEVVYSIGTKVRN